ncbi:MAG: SulP family inorganic anion transporter [Myxococcales bacterium]|nr:SulP family inorganic anion transporter [Myxococcales bacterium]
MTHHPEHKPLAHLRADIPSGLVVFLVALPLCLGIALASGAPPIGGLIAGIVGGLVVPWISGSPLSVSGPAAGLTAIVAAGITSVGGYEVFLVAVVVSGILQMLFGFLRLGMISVLFPSGVIKGMLAAIGLILILKQLPHAVGYDHEAFLSFTFQGTKDENTFQLLIHAVRAFRPAAAGICVLSVLLLILWQRSPRLSSSRWLPSALAVVVSGTLINEALLLWAKPHALEASHLVNIPLDVLGGLKFPDFAKALSNPKIYTLALTIAIVASLETLLCIEAVDKLDPWRRQSPKSRELIAQGLGQIAAGLLGGLPITSVIVRSSANVNAGGRTKAAAIVHGVFLLAAVLLLGGLMRRIPLSALAGVLLTVGFKLAHPRTFAAMYRAGWDQFVPFTSTVIAILFTDLLKGIGVGIVIGIVFVLRANMRGAFDSEKDGNVTTITLSDNVSFLSKWALAKALDAIPDGDRVVVDGARSKWIDRDIKELLASYQAAQPITGIEIEIKNVRMSDLDDGDTGGH